MVLFTVFFHAGNSLHACIGAQKWKKSAIFIRAVCLLFLPSLVEYAELQK
jgi:hypothetical protein